MAAFVAAKVSHAFDDTNSVTERKDRFQRERLNPTDFPKTGTKMTCCVFWNRIYILPKLIGSKLRVQGSKVTTDGFVKKLEFRFLFIVTH